MDQAEMITALEVRLGRLKNEVANAQTALDELRPEPKTITIELMRDGNQICALIGRDLVEGVAGFGDTAQDAIEDLLKRLDDEPLPEQLDIRAALAGL